MHTSKDTLENTVEQLAARLSRAERRARVSGALAAVAVGATLLLNIHPLALAQTPGVSLAAIVSEITTLQNEVAALQKQAPVPGPQGPAGPKGNAGPQGPQGQQGQQGPAGPGFTADKIAILNTMALTNGVGTDTELTFTGVNIHLVNGEGNTNTQNGLGNLIVGYNETGNPQGDTRTGSHNIVTGYNNSFSSSGGILGGADNTLSAGEEFCVGVDDSASGEFDSISGGYLNSASAYASSVSGGQQNSASAQAASVSGGGLNTASGGVASVGGGLGNKASGQGASVSGGFTVTADGSYDTGASGYYWDGKGPTWAATGSYSGH